MADKPIITCTNLALTEQQAVDLARWLAMGEAEVLRKVIESKIKEHLATATNEALQSRNTMRLEKSNAELEQAQRYADFLTILQEIKDTKKFVITKWT